jgi:hypothetical protein
VRAGLYLNFFLGSKLVVERPVAPDQADIVEITLQVIAFLNRMGFRSFGNVFFVTGVHSSAEAPTLA